MFELDLLRKPNGEYSMKTMSLMFLLVVLTGVLSIRGQGNAPLKLVQTIPIPGVEGRIDHLSADVKGQRLFVAALGNNTVEVVDLSQGKRIRSVTGLREPQGVVYVPELDQVVVANGDDGTVRTFDGKSFAMVSSLSVGADADNVRYDSASGRLVVGYGAGALGFIDAKTHKVIGTVKLSGHPESFQLEKSRPRIYVNVPDANHIAVIDSSKQTVITTWPVGQYRANFPMALDEAHHRLFVGARNPAKLLVFDTGSGKQITAMDISGDTDDVFFDQETKSIYVSAGEGNIDVLTQMDADHYSPVAKIPTAPGARTSLFVADLHKVFLAVPHRGAQEPAIRVYETVK
jgi:DNA-binding beta-propeller fold protein YncE